ncbi:MAG: cell division protein FtsQ/DivIB [Burkholderiales bacterium]|nr:cell division protein FtsQ/DivIB [Burkholderiales bacterium]
MWDDPRLLERAAAAAAALAAALALYGATQALARSPLLALRELRVAAPLAHTTRAEIEQAVAGFGGNFFAADLAGLRARLERLPWVRRVEVRRVWPDRIEARLEEHVAAARWGEAALVSVRGELFRGRLEAEQAARLPMLAGPPGSEAEVLRRALRFAEILAPLGEAPERVILNERRAWQLRTSGGLQLELGRDRGEPVERRLERFVAAYPATLGRLARAEARELRIVDLRYPNGFALRVPQWRS